jgi:hypothetical protein
MSMSELAKDKPTALEPNKVILVAGRKDEIKNAKN